MSKATEELLLTDEKDSFMSQGDTIVSSVVLLAPSDVLRGMARAEACTDRLPHKLCLKPHIAPAEPMAAEGTYVYRAHRN